jgi:TolB-like protein
MKKACRTRIFAVCLAMDHHFGPFTLDPDRFELRRDGVRVPMEPQVFLLLRHLVDHRDRLVTKDELVDAVFGGRAVSDAAIASRVRSAREAVGDDGTRQAVIRTVHGQGFRFVAEMHALPWAQVADTFPPTPKIAPTPSAKPSIAILPFQARALPPPLAVLTDAIPHEVIQALSRLRWLMVIARGSSFRFRGADPDVAGIGTTLNVRYILSGTVEADGTGIAVSTELCDTRTAAVIWADRFAAPQAGIPDLRAQIVTHIVAALEVYIPLNEVRTAPLGTSENLDAWSNYHLGLHHMYRFTATDNACAAALFARAVQQDPGFARAHAGLSFTRFQDAFMRYRDTPDVALRDARAHAETGVTLDPLDPFANFNMGRTYWLQGDLDRSSEWLGRAIALNPNYAQGHYAQAFTDMLGNRAGSALVGVDRAVTLSPLDPLAYGMLGTRAMSWLHKGDYAQAADWGNRAARTPGAHFLISMIALITNTLDRNDDGAKVWLADIRARRPDASQAHFFQSFPVVDGAVRHKISTALARHGL